MKLTTKSKKKKTFLGKAKVLHSCTHENVFLNQKLQLQKLRYFNIYIIIITIISFIIITIMNIIISITVLLYYQLLLLLVLLLLLLSFISLFYHYYYFCYSFVNIVLFFGTWTYSTRRESFRQVFNPGMFRVEGVSQHSN